MSEITLSVSKLRTFTQCPKKFFHVYHDKTGDDSTPLNQYGSLVHEALSLFENPALPKETDLLTFYQQCASKPEFSLVTQNLFEKGRKLLQDYLRDRLSGKKILCVERKFDGYLDNGVPWRAVIDRVHEVDADTIEVVDYKTGMSHFPTQWEVDEDLQLAVYDLIVRSWYPQYKHVKLTLHFFNGQPMHTERKDSQREALLEYLLIQKNKLEAEKEFKPRINEYCHACSYRTGCDLYQRVIKEPVEIATQGLGVIGGSEKRLAVKMTDFQFPRDTDAVILAIHQLDRKVKIQTKFVDELKAVISKHMELNQLTVLETDQFLVSTEQTKYENLDPQTVQKLLDPIDPKAFYSAAKVVKKRIDEFVKELERAGRTAEATQLTEALNRCVSVNYSKPSLRLETKQMMDGSRPEIPVAAPVSADQQLIGLLAEQGITTIDVTPKKSLTRAEKPVKIKSVKKSKKEAT